MNNVSHLADLIQKSDATDIQALLTAKENAKRRILDDPTPANVAAFERAKRALEAFTRPEEADERVFRNRIEALQHLQAQGYKIQKTNLYSDAQAGRLRLQPDGSITEKALERYIKRVGLTRPSEIADSGGLQAKKLALEISKLEEEYQERRFKNDIQEGKYLPRDQVYMELAGRAAVFEAGLKQALATRAADLLEALELIPEKHQRITFARRWFREIVDEQLNEFVNLKTFQALILDGSEEAEEPPAP